MTKEEIAAKIEAMKSAKTTPNITEPVKLHDGRWMHPMSQIKWDDETSCRTDFRFCKEWGRK